MAFAGQQKGKRMYRFIIVYNINIVVYNIKYRICFKPLYLIIKYGIAKSMEAHSAKTRYILQWMKCVSREKRCIFQVQRCIFQLVRCIIPIWRPPLRE